MSYTSGICLYPLQDWWKTVNEMSNFLYTGQIGNFIFHPARVLVLHSHSYAICVHFSPCKSPSPPSPQLCNLYALYVHKIQHEVKDLVINHP